MIVIDAAGRQYIFTGTACVEIVYPLAPEADRLTLFHADGTRISLIPAKA